MEERKIVQLKKEEFAMKELIKKEIGIGKMSKVKIDYTPVGEKIIISTSKPGLIIGRGGEKINELTEILKKNFSLENPHIEIEEILKPEFDAQLVADDIAMGLEKMGAMKFKMLAYRALQRTMNAGAMGMEIKLSGKLPSSRSKKWKFAQGYLKKTGEASSVVDKAKTIAFTKPGAVGIKISILRPGTKLIDRIEVTEELIAKLKSNAEPKKKVVKKKTTKKKVIKK